MQPYYSIIYALIRPDISEKISVGMIFSFDNKVSIKISHNKINVLKQLVPHAPFLALKQSVRNIEKKLSYYETANNIIEDGVFATLKLNVEPQEFSFGYIDYLSNYNNNIITFSKPTIIDIEFSESNTEMLYLKYVDNIIEKKPEIKQFSVFRNTFIGDTKVRNHFNVEQKITRKEIPQIIVPMKFDLVGMNKKPVFAQFLDLEKQPHAISNEINTLFSVHEQVPKSQKYLVSAEPNKKQFPEQHLLWKGLRNIKAFNYLHESEAGIIMEYASEHNVKPLISVD
ncbi:MAG TPA: hypothetical protein PLN13_06865 [Bacteroidia bacterium]|nr:hypothetical protein [Bacteroidia bacterium]HRH08286.1 hypothetical protein [Bacteroidia bacterium]